MTLTKRITKGSALTWEELDGNFDHLDGAKADKVAGATPGNLGALDGDGNLVDSGAAPGDFVSLNTDTDITVQCYDAGDGRYDPGDVTHFLTINAALKYLTETYQTVYVKAGVSAKIQLMDGFEMDEQVLVKDKDLSWITIEAESASAAVAIDEIVQGTEIQASQAEITDLTILAFDADASDLDGKYFVCQEADPLRYYYFHFNSNAATGPNEESIEIATDAADTPAQVAAKAEAVVDAITTRLSIDVSSAADTDVVTIDGSALAKGEGADWETASDLAGAIDALSDVSATSSGDTVTVLADENHSITYDKTENVGTIAFSKDGGLLATAADTVVTITNVADGAVAATYVSDTDRMTAAQDQEGQDQQNQAKIVTVGAHGLTTGDEVVIKDQVGLVEEQFYNGIWEVVVIDSTSFDLDHSVHGDDGLYDADRAGSGGTGEVVELTPVTVKRSACTELFEYFYRPAFGVANGKLPYINCLFEMDDSSNTDAGYQSYIDGLCAAERGEINIAQFCGFRNADGSNIYGTRTSVINANDAIASGAGRHGIWAYSNTQINARRAYVDGCGTQGTSEDQGDGWDSQGLPVGCGILSTRGSVINAEGATVINCLGDCVLAYDGGIINAGNNNQTGIVAGGSASGLAINSVGGQIFGVGNFGRHALVGDRLVGSAGYDKDHPGPKKLIAGNWDCGFFGEVDVEDLFGEGNDSDWFQDEIGMPGGEQGTQFHSDEPWLKLALKNKVVFYPKKAIRHSVSWDYIYAKGCVYGTGDVISSMEQEMLDTGEPEFFATAAHAYEGLYYGQWLQATLGIPRVPQTARVSLGGKEYIVRLMKGAAGEMSNHGLSDRGAVGMQNEWNRLILPLHEEVLLNNWGAFHNTDYSMYANTRTPDWGIYYSDLDLWTYYSHPTGNLLGSYVWMMEMCSDDRRPRAGRGNNGAAFLRSNSSWHSGAAYGFRPLLVPVD